ncbi:MAG: LIC_10190 family membrane protein [Dysgonomonas sp.]
MSELFFLGLCFIGTIISILSIWMPINSHIAWFSLIISILYTVYLYTVKRDRVLQKVVLCLHSQPLSAKLLILLVFAIVLYYSLLPPLVADARLYYLQSILWNETYPLIPGLGNIHGRLGFNSNILLLTSAFSFYDIFSFRVFAIVGLSVFVLIGWMITELVRQKDMVKAIITGIVCFAFLYEYGLGISSASTDIMPNVIVMFLLMKIIFDKDSLSQSPVMFWTLSLYALTLKLSIAPLCLLCVLILYTLARKKQYSQIVVLSVIAVFCHYSLVYSDNCDNRLSYISIPFSRYL